MSKTRTVLGVALVVAVLLVAGACSSGGGSSSSSSYCSKIKKYNSQGFNSDPTGKQAIKALEDVQKSAPSEIKSDLTYLVDTFKKFLNVDTNDPAAFASLASSVDTDKANSAEKNVESYTEKHCGVSLTS